MLGVVAENDPVSVRHDILRRVRHPRDMADPPRLLRIACGGCLPTEERTTARLDVDVRVSSVSSMLFAFRV